MSCIPHSGGCERPATDALVHHLNWRDGTQYEHRGCLDQLDRINAQPECLYADNVTGRELVIERKSLLWPASYAHHHAKDHELANAIFAAVAGVEFPHAYTLAMPHMGTQPKALLIAAGQRIGQQIREHHAKLQACRSLRINCLGKTFTLTIRAPEDRSENEPDRGITLTWDLPWTPTDPTPLAEKLADQLQKIFAACVNKFATYTNARRILLLDPHGDLAFTSTESWRTLFTNLTPPDAIDDIWIGQHSTDDFDEDEWFIDNLYRRTT
jgi:hypothetical protein